MHFEIRRGYRIGKPLTTAQRRSGTFAEEPVVLGKVLRRGMRPMMLSEEQFGQHKTKLLRLLLAGSVEIEVVDGANRTDYRAVDKSKLPKASPLPPDMAGDQTPSGEELQAPTETAANTEELEASEPPSSGAQEPSEEPVVPETPKSA